MPYTRLGSSDSLHDISVQHNSILHVGVACLHSLAVTCVRIRHHAQDRGINSSALYILHLITRSVWGPMTQKELECNGC